MPRATTLHAVAFTHAQSGFGVTDVWKTLRGNRYHKSPDCTALRDGHAKAASEGWTNHPPMRLALSEAEDSVEPCTVCWRESFAADRWLAKALVTEVKAQSSYELDFLNLVLRHVKGLDPDYVRVQQPAVEGLDNRYFIDYAVVRPHLPKLAIEIDGFQKVQNQNEADEARQRATATRQNALTSAGWRILRFTNHQVITDPGACRIDIEKTLEKTANDHAARRPDPSHQAPPEAAVRQPARVRVTAPVRTARRPGPRVIGFGIGIAAILLATTIAVVAANQGGTSDSSVEPRGNTCPGGYPVKGNVSQGGDEIYHRPGWRYYDSTTPEECFKSAGAAEDAGYRASLVQ